VQDVVMKAAKNKKGLDSETVQKLHNLNMDRNRLMREIDEVFDAGCRAGKARVDARVKVT